jgi:hypothetical protein
MKCLAPSMSLRRGRWFRLLPLWSVASIAFFGVVLLGTLSARAGVGTPPDVCNDVTCDDLPSEICTDLGFQVELVDFMPANTSDSGAATYIYQICVPPLGTCTTGFKIDESCADNDACGVTCTGRGLCAGTEIPCTGSEDCAGTCDRDCAVDKFHSLSHLDVLFPPLGELGSCLSDQTEVSGTCMCTGESSSNCAPQTEQALVIGQDPSCSAVAGIVAKCDSTELEDPEDCIQVNLMIAGETNGLGLGAAVVADKASTDCTASCIAGPSCEPCDGNGGKEECLTRTLGFWGTHPEIAGRFDPVTVCGYEIDGQEPMDCSTSEALCTSALDYHSNRPYLALVAQLTAAKLNLNATGDLVDDGTTTDDVCSEFTYQDKTIQEWIAYCEENFCHANKKTISNSGCIEALDFFNQDKDTGFDVTPAPFDHPGPADPSKCKDARGNGEAIGHNLCTVMLDQVEEGAPKPKGPKPGKNR